MVFQLDFSRSAQKSRLEQFDGCGVPAGGGQGRIPGDKRGLQGFGQCQVRRIVGSEVVAQCPDAGQEQIVRIADEGENRTVLKSLRAAIRGQRTARRVSSQHLRDFQID